MKARAGQRPDVVFAVVPFANLPFPVIGVSLLKAQLARLGYRSAVRYFNLDFAERIGSRSYMAIADSFGSAALLGEWVFSGLLGNDEEDEDWYAMQFLADFPDRNGLLDLARQARGCAQQAVEQWTEELLRLRPRVVGFPTSFQQNAGCLALARRLKQARRPPLVVFGGANCLGEMGLGLLRAFPWIDYVCTGEGDDVFPEFIGRVVADEDTASIPGILKQGFSTPMSAPPLIHAMDELPIPDYSDYFRHLRRLRLDPPIDPVLLIETSRGCWWGEKHHCTFCSIWDNAMGFRSKSAERAAREYRTLARRHGIRRFLCVDNIMDMRYISTLFPKLAGNGSSLEIFYEVKANLRYDQLRLMRRGGVRWIQPGIESFSSDILRLMKKGCTGIQNLQLLRWTQELGIGVEWNMLLGFPGESPSEYARMAELVQKIPHLYPPADVVQIRLDRYSPNFNEPDHYGFCDVRPSKYYAHVFSVPAEELRLMAHFFDYDYADGRDPMEYTAAFRAACAQWQNLYRTKRLNRPQLDAWDDGSEIRIEDRRACTVRPGHRLIGLPADVLRALDTGRSVERLHDALGKDVRREDLLESLRTLVALNLVVEWEGQYLSLPVFRARASMPAAGPPSREARDEKAGAPTSEPVGAINVVGP